MNAKNKKTRNNFIIVINYIQKKLNLTKDGVVNVFQLKQGTTCRTARGVK